MTDDATSNLPIGQLLLGALRGFRADLLDRVNAAGNEDVRLPHFQVFGAIDWRGTRLQELARRTGMTAPSMWELVEDLQRLGYVERVADPSDRRAKLVRPTRRGRRALTIALRAVAEIEAEYAAAVGDDTYRAGRTVLAAIARRDRQPEG